MDNRQALLTENEGKRITIKMPLLICFAMFSAWQMGMVYFSGQTLSVDGRTPLPVTVGNLNIIIAAGYILSIIVMIFLPRIIVWAERITAITALLSALALYLPASPETLAAALYIQFFCCCFMIGFETAVIVGLFTERTAVVHLTAAYGIVQLFIVVLHNDFIKIGYPVFRLFSVAALVMMVFFFFRLPGNVWPHSVEKSDRLAAPKNLFAGVLLWTGMSCLLALFGNAVAEGTPHGVSLLYLSVTVFSIAMYLLWKICGVMPLRTISVIAAMGAMGFILAIASLYVPVLRLAACVFLGAGCICCWLNPLFGVLLAKQYPSRYISPGIIGVAFITVMIHSGLLSIFRGNETGLYIVYLVIAVGLVIIHLMLEPYLLYSFRGRTLKDIIGVVAEETEEETAEPESAPVKRAALLTKTETVKPVTPEDKSFHERRMKILMTHALSPLTNREYQLADCIMRGLRRSEIAQEMGIEPESITKYSNRIYNKFAIHRRQDLFKLAEKLDREWDGEK